jgi:hypothetical protein
MANYYGEARTNYFNVKDEEAFLSAMSEIPGIDVQQDKDGFVILGNDCDGYNTWYKWGINDEEFDIPQMVAEHLADGEVAVFLEIGNEKLRYLAGVAIAVNNKGQERTISLENIYDLASELTDKEVSRAEY